jgi:hypothetical protein
VEACSLPPPPRRAYRPNLQDSLWCVATVFGVYTE